MDVDIWINKFGQNLEQLYVAFVELGYSKENSRKAVGYFRQNHKIELPRKQNLVEIIDSYIIKLDFDSVYKNRVKVKIGSLELNMIGYADLLECKRNSNRVKDLEDVRNLKKIRELDQDKIKKSQKNKRGKGFRLI